MKKIILLFLLLPQLAFAEVSQGSAFIPYYWSASASGSEMGLTITNITDDDIQVMVSMYDYNGVLLTGTGKMTQLNGVALNYSEVNPDNTVSFSIPANATVALGYGSWNGNGHGKIVWTQDGQRQKGLIAYSLRNYNGSMGVAINGGQPF